MFTRSVDFILNFFHIKLPTVDMFTLQRYAIFYLLSDTCKHINRILCIPLAWIGIDFGPQTCYVDLEIDSPKISAALQDI